MYTCTWVSCQSESFPPFVRVRHVDVTKYPHDRRVFFFTIVAHTWGGYGGAAQSIQCLDTDHASKEKSNHAGSAVSKYTNSMEGTWGGAAINGSEYGNILT